MSVEFRQAWAEQRQAIVNEYLDAHPDQTDWTMEDVAAWAIREDKWQPPHRNAIKMCASELSRASRVEYYEDPQGRIVRKKYARRESVTVDGMPRQMVFWEDITNARPEHMLVALQQMRAACLADNARLKRNTDSWNENNPHGAHVQLSFDYSEDLLELESPEDYPNSAPDADEEDGEI